MFTAIMTRRNRKVDEGAIMRAVIALNKKKLNDADYRILAQQLKIPRSRIKKVVAVMHPYLEIKKT